MPQVPVTTDRENAPTVTVKLPQDDAVLVEIPVDDVTTGTVAVLVKADGTEEIIKTSLPTEDGVAVTLKDGDTVKIVDNSKNFTDVSNSYWGSQYIDFVTSRELFSGTGADTFSPDVTMTRGMIVTVLAAYDGANTASTGGAWYEAGRQWAMGKWHLRWQQYGTDTYPGAAGRYAVALCGQPRQLQRPEQLCRCRQHQQLRPAGNEMGGSGRPDFRRGEQRPESSGSGQPCSGGHHPDAVYRERLEVKRNVQSADDPMIVRAPTHKHSRSASSLWRSFGWYVASVPIGFSCHRKNAMSLYFQERR